MASRGLKHKVPQLEDLIGEGFRITPVVGPYTKLADDPRVRAYSNLGSNPEEFRRLEYELRAARAFHDEVRLAAMGPCREMRDDDILLDMSDDLMECKKQLKGIKKQWLSCDMQLETCAARACCVCD